MTGLQSASEGTRVLCLTHLVGEANERPRSWGAAPPQWSHALHGAVLAAVSSPGSSEGSQALVRVPGQQASLLRAILASHLLGAFWGPSGSTCRACLCHQRRLGCRTTSPGVGRGARVSLQTLRSTGLTLVPLWPLRNSGVESVAQSRRAACRPDTQPHTGICCFLVSVSVCPGPDFFFNVDLFMWLHGTLLEARELLVAAGGDWTPLIREGAQSPCFGSAEFKTLDHQIVFIHIFSTLLYVFLSFVE